MKRSPSENDLSRKKVAGDDSSEVEDTPYVYFSKNTFFEVVDAWVVENVIRRALVRHENADFWVQFIDAEIQKDVWLGVSGREEGGPRYDGYNFVFTLYSDLYEDVTLGWSQHENTNLGTWLTVQLFYWMYPSDEHLATRDYDLVPKIPS